MSDPTLSILRTYETDKQRFSSVIKTSEALVVGGFAGIDQTTQKVEFGDDASKLIPAGVVIGQSNGDNTSLTGDGTVAAVTRGGILMKSVAVTGASAATDFMKPVYCTDGQTLTLTQPSAGVACGRIAKWISSTTCDVYLYDPIEASERNRGAKKYKSFGTYGLDAFSGTSAQTCHTETSLEHYKIISLHALPRAFDAGVIAGAQTFNLAIGGTDTAGGVLTLGYASFDATGDMGTVIDATAITAANEVHMGDTVILEMAAFGTGFTANQSASVEIYAVIEEIPGA